MFVGFGVLEFDAAMTPHPMNVKVGASVVDACLRLVSYWQASDARAGDAVGARVHPLMDFGMAVGKGESAGAVMK